MDVKHIIDKLYYENNATKEELIYLLDKIKEDEKDYLLEKSDKIRKKYYDNKVYMRGLIENGRVYIALPPLYKISIKNHVEYAWTDEELREKIGNSKNVTIQRFKGLGEMNFTQLWETTMNPETRTLIRVGIEDFSEADNRVSILMGDEVEPRREWIENNVSFDNEDNFTLENIEVIGDE